MSLLLETEHEETMLVTERSRMKMEAEGSVG